MPIFGIILMVTLKENSDNIHNLSLFVCFLQGGKNGAAKKTARGEAAAETRKRKAVEHRRILSTMLN
jgi:hypothetical protein